MRLLPTTVRHYRAIHSRQKRLHLNKCCTAIEENFINSISIELLCTIVEASRCDSKNFSFFFLLLTFFMALCLSPCIYGKSHSYQSAAHRRFSFRQIFFSLSLSLSRAPWLHRIVCSLSVDLLGHFEANGFLPLFYFR